MAGERTFTEGEAYALVADAVERETAAAKTQVADLEAQIVSLGNEKDALELRATAAEEKAANAEKALADYKAEVETQKAMEAKRDERLGKVAEVAPKLEVTEERATRIVAMEDELFDEYVESLRQVASEGGKSDDGKPEGVKREGTPLPRESAAFKGGKTGEAGRPTPSVKGVFGARARALAPVKSA